MIGILISLAVLAAVAWVAFYILGLLPIPEPGKQIVTVVLALVFLLMVLRQLGVWVPL